MRYSIVKNLEETYSCTGLNCKYKPNRDILKGNYMVRDNFPNFPEKWTGQLYHLLCFEDIKFLTPKQQKELEILKVIELMER